MLLRRVRGGGVETIKYIDPNWLVGFTEGEGRFRVDIKKSISKLGKTVRLNLQIKNESDKEL